MYPYLATFILLLNCCCLSYYHSNPFVASSSSDSIDNSADNQAKPGIYEIDSFKAIRTLHTKLDSDADGEVDDYESKRFLESDKVEVNGVGNGGSTAHKLRYLHQDGKDRSISVDELWKSWKASQVYNWTIDDTIYWLVNYVELPEYSILFKENSVNGTLLPRLAADTQFLSKLGITEPSAKSKISIKAMDVVLFGPPKLGNYSKLRDIIVSIVILIAVSACFVFYTRNRASQLALKATVNKLELLQKSEEQMSELQQELNKALKAQEAVATEKKNLEHQLEMHLQYSSSSLNKKGNDDTQRSTSDNRDDDEDEASSKKLYLTKLEEQVKSLREELKKTYDAKKFRAPLQLRHLLQATYNIESQYYNEKKLNLEIKATEVKLRNQKLQKKKTSFLGLYKMAQENSLEEDINSIVEIKEAIMQVTREVKERTERWRAIEEICGCSLNLIQLTSSVSSHNIASDLTLDRKRGNLYTMGSSVSSSKSSTLMD